MTNFLNGKHRTFVHIGEDLFGETSYVGFNSDYEDFGNYFLCDGVADDVEIQVAVEYAYRIGGSVVCERGTYDIQSTVESYAGISLMGEWAGLSETPATRFLANASLDAPIVKLLVHPAHAGDLYFPHISKILLEGNDDNTKTNQHGLHISNENGPFADCFVDHVWCISNGAYGFYIHDGKTYLHDIYAENNRDNGIYILGQTLIDITRAYVFGNYVTGIKIDDAVIRCSIRDSWIIANVMDGIWANNMDGNSTLNIEGCDFDANQRYNLLFGDVDNFHVTNNFFRDTVGGATDAHIFIAELCDDGLISHNSFADIANPNIIVLPANAINLNIRDNLGYNPLGNITNPFENVLGLVGIPAGGVATPIANTDYTVRGMDIIISSTDSGNTDCAIMLKDPGGNNVLQAALSTIDYMHVPRKLIITWGNFTGAAPTVTVSGI